MTSATGDASGPVVVVTGGSQGIGAAVAERFSAALPGVRLALVARDRERLEKVADRCIALGAQTLCVAADLVDTAQVERMAARVQAQFGSVDVLVNNAGRWRGGAAHEMSVGDFARTLEENLVSMFAVTRAFLPGMLSRQRGDLFFMSSTSGLEGLANNAAYCAAKHGVAGLAKAVRAETAGQGIRVCCIYPGATDTPTWDGSDVDRTTLMAADDVAQLVVDSHRQSTRAMVEELVVRPTGRR
ncbi:SDR family oxidoreductase [Sinimarinibacterium flocculans]|uniref:SDR family oxidoreductase n=1 Tax=Sinimarinibacterium flocculans TaxID=985250 RepID=UPI003513A592